MREVLVGVLQHELLVGAHALQLQAREPRQLRHDAEAAQGDTAAEAQVQLLRM